MNMSDSTRMTAKLIVTLGCGNAGAVEVERDGVRTKLLTVTGIHIDDRGEARVTMWTRDMDGTFEISHDTAAALVQLDSDRSIAFLDDEDAAALKHLHEALPGTALGIALSHGVSALAKIVAVLAKRQAVPW